MPAGLPGLASTSGPSQRSQGTVPGHAPYPQACMQCLVDYRRLYASQRQRSPCRQIYPGPRYSVGQLAIMYLNYAFRLVARQKPNYFAMKSAPLRRTGNYSHTQAKSAPCELSFRHFWRVRMSLCAFGGVSECVARLSGGVQISCGAGACACEHCRRKPTRACPYENEPRKCCRP